VFTVEQAPHPNAISQKFQSLHLPNFHFDIMTLPNSFKKALFASLALFALLAQADEAVIRKNLAARIPQLQAIDEVSKGPIAGLFEIRVNGTEIYYTDAEGNYLIQGSIIDTKVRRNLTEDRVDKLTAVSFDALPLKDAFTIVRGNGKRKIAVFEDPNCGYCKRFERDLQGVNNVTISMFLYPILGADSAEKSKNIWCAKDKAKAWQDWMVRDVNAPVAAANCDTAALTRNVELGRKHKITGTPTLLFMDGSRVPGAISAAQVEKILTDMKM
jgi:thiol:disulfide interchange protein DsbC